MTPEEDRMIARIEQQAYVKGLADGKAEERAAKIVLMIRAENTSALAHSQIQEVAAEIGAAVEEAHGAACENLIAQCHQHVAQAYEDAAKIAETYVVKPHPDYFVQEYRDLCMAGVAVAIRARAAEVGK